jgi:hypothetical protein
LTNPVGNAIKYSPRVDREEVRSVFRFTLPTSDELAGSGR